MSDTKIRSMKATAALRDDHKKVKHLFSEYEKLGEKGKPEAKQKLFDEMNKELTIHATIEEEIFYPAIAELKAEDEQAGDIVNEAQEEHKIVKTLLAELSGLDPEDEQFDAKVTVLMENVRHHAGEEEKDMFPFFEDLPEERQDEVSEKLRLRKAELMRTEE